MPAMHDHIGLVLDDPFDHFCFFQLHSFGDGSGEVDVVLMGRFLSFDELNLSRISHEKLLSNWKLIYLALMLEQ